MSGLVKPAKKLRINNEIYPADFTYHNVINTTEL